MDEDRDTTRIERALCAFLQAWHDEPDPLYRQAWSAAVELLEDALVEATASEARAALERPHDEAQQAPETLAALRTGEGRLLGSQQEPALASGGAHAPGVGAPVRLLEGSGDAPPG